MLVVGFRYLIFMRIRSWTDSALVAAVSTSFSVSEVMRKLGLFSVGGSHATVRDRIQELDISTVHFRRIPRELRKIPVEELFVAHSNWKGKILRPAILRNNLITYRCSLCHCGPTHNKSPLVLQLDHISGDNTDNRLENLRFLCPNCHSQTPTFAGRGIRRPRNVRIPDKDSDGKIIPHRSTRIVDYDTVTLRFKELKNYSVVGEEFGITDAAVRRIVKKSTLITEPIKTIKRPTKQRVWPEDSILKDMLWKEPATTVAKTLGISSSAVKKHCRLQNITTPTRGYWAKQQALQLKNVVG